MGWGRAWVSGPREGGTPAALAANSHASTHARLHADDCMSRLMHTLCSRSPGFALWPGGPARRLAATCRDAPPVPTPRRGLGHASAEALQAGSRVGRWASMFSTKLEKRNRRKLCFGRAFVLLRMFGWLYLHRIQIPSMRASSLIIFALTLLVLGCHNFR